MLNHLAEDAALPSEINLWPTIQVRLAMEKQFSQIREPKMNANIEKTKRYRLGAIGVLTLILVFGIILALPQGQAWAQSLLQFFIPTKDQITLPTPIPVNLVDVTPGASQPTLEPTASWHLAFSAVCGEFSSPQCSIEKIRQMVKFSVKGISNLPKGMLFIGATGGPEGIALVYHRSEPNSTIILMQSPVSSPDQKAIPVGSSAAVEQVTIGNITGEYVKGSYFHFAGDPVAKWDPNADAQSLRWEENGTLYNLSMTGSIDFSEYTLDKNGLVRLAVALTNEVSTATSPSFEDPKSVAEVGEEAGYKIIEPSWMPEGYRFDRAEYFPDRKIVCLEYHHPADQSMRSSFDRPSPSLSIAESVSAPLPDVNELIVSGLRPDQVLLETASLAVGGAVDGHGLYAYGSLDVSKICNIPSFQSQVLFVQVRGLNIAIFAQTEGPVGSERNWLTRQEMVKLAESMTGVRTIAPDQLDPEFITSLEDAKKLVSFPLKFPTKLPDGMNFYYAKVSKDGNTEVAIIKYSDGNQMISFIQTKGSADTLETLLKKDPEVYRQVNVHSLPAIITQGYFNQNGWKEMANGGDGGASVTWFENGIKYSVSGFNAFPTQVWLEIAEGVQ